MNFEIRRFSDNFSFEWDNFVIESNSPSFLFLRKYIEYHKDRYHDFSIMIFNENELIALLPSAISPDNEELIISHPGISYGGLITKKNKYGIFIRDILINIIDYYRAHNFKNFIYKPIPFFYKINKYDDETYFLLTYFNGEIFKTNLTSTIDLRLPILTSNRRRRSYKNSLKNNLSIEIKPKFLESYWELLTENLLTRYQVNPVHTYQEISYLISIFPDSIKPFFVLDNKKNLIAGTIIYLVNNVVHIQYVASNTEGRKLFALDFLFNQLFINFIENNYIWFDFGISDDNNGLNKSLYEFKSEFGANSYALNNLIISL